MSALFFVSWVIVILTYLEISFAGEGSVTETFCCSVLVEGNACGTWEGTDGSAAGEENVVGIVEEGA